MRRESGSRFPNFTVRNTNMSQDPVVIVGMARTPMGGFQGDLKDVPAPQLGAAAIKAALENAGITGDEVDEVIMGNILQQVRGRRLHVRHRLVRVCRSRSAARPSTRCAAPA